MYSWQMEMVVAGTLLIGLLNLLGLILLFMLLRPLTHQIKYLRLALEGQRQDLFRLEQRSLLTGPAAEQTASVVPVWRPRTQQPYVPLEYPRVSDLVSQQQERLVGTPSVTPQRQRNRFDL
jgi:hypothetical protein